MRATAVVMIVVTCAGLYSWVASTVGLVEKGSAVLLSMSDNQWVVLMMINIILLLAGMLLDAISEDMLARAEEVQRSRVQDIDSMDDIPQDKILRLGWCGCDECGHKFEDTTGFKILGRPYHPEEYSGKCIICGKPVDQPAYAAHTM